MNVRDVAELKQSITYFGNACTHKKVLKAYNNFMTRIKKENEQVLNYNNIYNIGKSPSTSMIKIKLIQEMIHMERPKNWCKNNIEKIVNEIINIEKYNASKKHSMDKFNLYWNFIEEKLTN
jgi:hypothetical protein